MVTLDCNPSANNTRMGGVIVRCWGWINLNVHHQTNSNPHTQQDECVTYFFHDTPLIVTHCNICNTHCPSGYHAGNLQCALQSYLDVKLKP